MGEGDRWAALDQRIPRSLREEIEESLWRPIEARSTLEVLKDDPRFLVNPGSHPAMFADHGVVHVRDVATGLLHLTETMNGLFLPTRPTERVSFMQTVGVAMAYIHDVGMVDMTHVGRAVHALYGAHVAFTSDVDALVDHLLSPGPVRERLAAVERTDPFGVPLDTVVREMLSLAVAHSKSTVPAGVLTDPARLARRMRRIVFTSMAEHRVAAGGRPDDDAGAPTGADGVEHPRPEQAYAWLTATTGPQADLAHDLVDTVRVLRAADVLRQRGSALRTSGGFEVFFDARTGQAVCTLRPADGRSAYLVTYEDHRGAGEANITMAMVTRRGELRIGFHRGSFLGVEAAHHAATSVADAILDIWADVGPSFIGVQARDLPAPTRTAADLTVQLQRPADDPAFADLVAEILRGRNPDQAHAVVVVPDLDSAHPLERERYEQGASIDPSGRLAGSILEHVGEHGTDTSHVDRSAAFAEMRWARVAAGEALVAEGSFPAFVYIPLGSGLTVHPVGGYPPAALHPWVPVGVTGAVRKAPRNGDIVAERDVEVAMIPSEEFVTVWLRPLRPHHLAERLARRA